MAKEDILQVGVVTSPHGVRGEVKVFPTTDDPRRFQKLKQVLMDTGKGYDTMEIESVKFFKNMVIVKFAGIDSRDAAEAYRQKGLFVTRQNAVKLRKGEYFIADLIGLLVIDEDGDEIGTLQDVMQTGANDVYVVAQKEGGELLLPAIKQCILDVDVDAGLVKVHILEGLLD
ncbi:MAG: ribosome maturation factor RimM [Candidatus Gastranaerophilales bacterium]|nr:ribosome maturation factor RimM [Candidatus Gastranaerophilales bacterium]